MHPWWFHWPVSAFLWVLCSFWHCYQASWTPAHLHDANIWFNTSFWFPSQILEAVPAWKLALGLRDVKKDTPSSEAPIGPRNDIARKLVQLGFIASVQHRSQLKSQERTMKLISPKTLHQSSAASTVTLSRLFKKPGGKTKVILLELCWNWHCHVMQLAAWRIQPGRFGDSFASLRTLFCRRPSVNSRSWEASICTCTQRMNYPCMIVAIPLKCQASRDEFRDMAGDGRFFVDKVHLKGCNRSSLPDPLSHLIIISANFCCLRVNST